MSKSIEDDRPVFYDPSGKRWLWIKTCILALVCAFGYGAYSFAPYVLTPDKTVAATTSAADIEPRYFTNATILQETAGRNVPVIGEGSLLRMVLVTQKAGRYIAVDVHSKKATKTLTSREVAAVGDGMYAIERYGTSEGRYIALTFDDGPDPIFSPQLLDILAAENTPSSFFVTGENVLRYPEIANRMVDEGHILGNHTFSHINFDFANLFTATQEINQTRRIMRTVTRHDSTYFRIPYGGNNDQDIRNDLSAILEAQKLGYTVSSFTFDTNDWDERASHHMPMPSFNGEAIVALLHDGGGDRTNTVAYVTNLIKKAKQQGYTFVHLDQLSAGQAPRFYAATPGLADSAALAVAKTAIVWPREVVNQLFVITIITLLLGLIIISTFAILEARKPLPSRRSKKYRPLVSVIIPAYNEGVVLKKTVRSVLESHYKRLEIIIVDDGSQDETWEVACSLSNTSKLIRSFRQPRNKGKAAALNMAIKQARGEIVICIDADTLFSPSTVGRLTRHFEDPAVGAVAGAVKVGNVRNILTRWQGLEYTVGVYLERGAHSYLKSIMIVPGACGAWRTSAVLAAGGFSNRTLAEDCDLTLSLRQKGFQVVQDVTAVSYTEAPNTIKGLAKQRFRWIFGTIQSIWKHRNMFLNEQFGWLGLFVMPYAALNIILPLLFTPLLIILALENIAAGRYMIMVLFLLVTLGIQYILAAISLIIARERLSYLLVVPLTRLIYSPLKGYLLYRSALTAFKGSLVGWNKLQRSGTVHLQTQNEMEVSKAKP